MPAIPFSEETALALAAQLPTLVSAADEAGAEYIVGELGLFCSLNHYVPRQVFVQLLWLLRSPRLRRMPSLKPVVFFFSTNSDALSEAQQHQAVRCLDRVVAAGFNPYGYFSTVSEIMGKGYLAGLKP